MLFLTTVKIGFKILSFFQLKGKGKKWTKQDDSAVIIQKYTRRHLAKKELAKRKKDKQEYEELMDKIQKEVGLDSRKCHLDQENGDSPVALLSSCCKGTHSCCYISPE